MPVKPYVWNGLESERFQKPMPIKADRAIFTDSEKVEDTGATSST